MQIPRYLSVEQRLEPGKVLVLLGPRRSGKTTLLRDFTENTERDFVLYSGDLLSFRERFSIQESSVLDKLIADHDVLIIDEAQMIPGAGKSLKLIVDTHPDLEVVVTGSSAFELNGQIGEPLTGRKNTRLVLPIAVSELLNSSKVRLPKKIDFEQKLPDLLVYGMYPNALTASSEETKTDFLRELTDSYLLKDILTFQEVKGSRVIARLLSLLAFQVGGLVSLSELGTTLGIDKNTVDRYLDLLEKSFVIYRLGGLRRNGRSEIAKMAKYYFYDNGVRNAVIGNFNRLEMRNDLGQLWENFAMSERLKHRSYHPVYANQYFWRTWKGSEIDLVEEREGKYFGYEMKWNSNKKITVPIEWTAAYGDQAEWQLITPENFLSFVS